MSDNKGKVSWNASQGIIMELSNRRSLANSFFVNDDIRKAFKTLISIKQSVIQSFKEKERVKLKIIEDKFNRVVIYLSHSSSNSFNKEFRQSFLNAKQLATKFYSEYNDLLMDLLEERGYMISSQTDASVMKF